MKSRFKVTIEVTVTFDPSDPAAAVKALTWCSELKDKKLVEPPEGVDALIETKTGAIQNSRD